VTCINQPIEAAKGAVIVVEIWQRLLSFGFKKVFSKEELNKIS
jgi:hypothetical protein